jgi:hypothetical protein
MSRFVWAMSAAFVGACVGWAGQSAPAKDALPDFPSNNVAWIAINSDFTPLPRGPKPLGFDPKYRFVRNDQPGPASYRPAALGNPNLRPWVVAQLKRYNDKVFVGEIGTTPRWQRLPGGVPGVSIFVVEPVFILQGHEEVLLIYSGNHEVRDVYRDGPHSAKLKPSWYSESAGHYEGDTLVVDTIGLSEKAVIDHYHTPHTQQLDVTERYHLIEAGKQLEVNLAGDDPGAFNAPRPAVQRYDRARRPRTLATNRLYREQRQHLPLAVVRAGAPSRQAEFLSQGGRPWLQG